MVDFRYVALDISHHVACLCRITKLSFLIIEYDPVRSLRIRCAGHPGCAQLIHFAADPSKGEHIFPRMVEVEVCIVAHQLFCIVMVTLKSSQIPSQMCGSKTPDTFQWSRLIKLEWVRFGVNGSL